MEDDTESPARKPEVAEEQVIRSKRISRRYRLSDLSHALLVRHEVECGEDNRTRLLNAHDPEKRPFPMILHYWIYYWRLVVEPPIGNDVLASVVAF